jgi:ArsR family transcriptional regulator, arsenate/arsenite/antimonite-responsive transcriptional repressor
MNTDFMELAALYKAFCDENRLQIVELLSEGEHCACDLLEQLQIGQSTLSHHMHILIESGIVSFRKAGKWTYYALSDTGCDKAIASLKTILTIKERQITSCACEEINHDVSGH